MSKRTLHESDRNTLVFVKTLNLQRNLSSTTNESSNFLLLYTLKRSATSQACMYQHFFEYLLEYDKITCSNSQSVTNNSEPTPVEFLRCLKFTVLCDCTSSSTHTPLWSWRLCAYSSKHRAHLVDFGAVRVVWFCCSSSIHSLWTANQSRLIGRVSDDVCARKCIHFVSFRRDCD